MALRSKTKKATTKTPAKPSKLPIPRRFPVGKKANEAEAAAPAGRPTGALVAAAEAAPEPAEAAEAGTAATAATVAAGSLPEAAGKLSCLDAAAEVLKGAAEPMRCRELVDAMREKGLWTSTAPTPHQTLASALLREITKKGPASRFRKADRGRFALNAG